MDFMSLGNFLQMSTRKLSLTRVAGLGRWKRKTDAEEGTRLGGVGLPCDQLRGQWWVRCDREGQVRCCGPAAAAQKQTQSF